MKSRSKKFNDTVRERNRRIVREVKEKSGCVKCHIKDFRVLDFHHLSNKAGSIGDTSSLCWSEHRLREEISKCEVLCANCHRIETWVRRVSEPVSRKAHNLESRGATPGLRNQSERAV